MLILSGTDFLSIRLFLHGGSMVGVPSIKSYPATGSPHNPDSVRQLACMASCSWTDRLAALVCAFGGQQQSIDEVQFAGRHEVTVVEYDIKVHRIFAPNVCSPWKVPVDRQRWQRCTAEGQGIAERPLPIHAVLAVQFCLLAVRPAAELKIVCGNRDPEI